MPEGSLHSESGKTKGTNKEDLRVVPCELQTVLSRWPLIWCLERRRYGSNGMAPAARRMIHGIKYSGGIAPLDHMEKSGSKSLYGGEVLANTTCAPLCSYESMYKQRS